MTRVRIESDGRPAGTTISVDGVKLGKVLSFRLEGDPKNGIRLHLTTLVDEVDVDGEIETKIERP